MCESSISIADRWQVDMVERMRLRSLGELSTEPAAQTFRPARAWPVVALLVCLCLSAVGPVMMASGQWAFGAYWSALGLLCCVVSGVKSWRALFGGAWLMQLQSKCIRVRIATVGAPPTPADRIAEISIAEIESIRAERSATLTEHGGEVTSSRDGYLAIKLRNVADVDALRNPIADASRPQISHGWTIHRAMPVRVSDEGVIRLQWYGNTFIISPGLNATVKRLGKVARVEQETFERIDLTGKAVSSRDADDQIVREIERGQRISAIKLVRQHYRMSLADAKRFVDSLAGPTDKQ
jgi:hypothetical protein